MLTRKVGHKHFSTLYEELTKELRCKALLQYSASEIHVVARHVIGEQCLSLEHRNA